MAYSKDQISTIHQNATAKQYTKYVTITGEVFEGQASGRLRLVDRDTIRNSIAISNISSTPEKTEIVQSSYFGIDYEGDLTPIDNIQEVLQNNIFVLDLSTGDLTPTDIANNNALDSFFEFNADSDITPKVL